VLVFLRDAPARRAAGHSWSLRSMVPFDFTLTYVVPAVQWH